MASPPPPSEENWSALSNLHVTGEDNARTSNKSSLSFILDGKATGVAALLSEDKNSDSTAVYTEEKQIAPSDSHYQHQQQTSVRPTKKDVKRKARRPPSRICKHEGCEQYVVDQGLCVRHGGGKRCQTEGCTSRAKHQGKCWRHGGSIECKVPTCINRAKSRGYCWSHGGGTKCKADTCEKIAISNGLCWAHGGGKRCIVVGCMRQAYERTNNYCNTHFHELQLGEAVGSSTEDDGGKDE